MSVSRNGRFSGKKFGEIAKTREDLPFELSLEWRIEDFLSHIIWSRSAVKKVCYMSPIFEFCNRRCYFSVWPCYTIEASEWVILRLSRVEERELNQVPRHLRCNPEDELPPQTFHFSVGIKGSNGVEMIQKTQKEFQGFLILHEWTNFCLTSELMEQGSRLMPNNILTITCDLKRIVPSPARENVTSELSEKGIQEEKKEVNMSTVEDEIMPMSVDIADDHSIHELRAAVESFTIQEHSLADILKSRL